jgi:hypothetical protein
LIARHMTRRAPNESVAKMTTVFMPDILLRRPRCVIVAGDRKIASLFVSVAQYRREAGGAKPSICTRAAAQATLTAS